MIHPIRSKTLSRIIRGATMVALALCSLQPASAFQPTSYETSFYVSANAPAGGDGSSWEKAWNSFSQIPWSKIPPGTNIVIDGGSSGMVYKSGLTVPPDIGTAAYPVNIVTSSQAGHNGLVTILAQRSTGIFVSRNSAVRIYGMPIDTLELGSISTAKLRILAAGGNGIVVAPFAKFVSIVAVRVQDCTGNGIVVNGGDEVIISTSEIVNNRGGSQLVLAAQAEETGMKNRVVVDQCWIHCDKPGIGAQTSEGLVNNGIVSSPQYKSPYGVHLIRKSFIGPGLTDDIRIYDDKPSFYYRDSKATLIWDSVLLPASRRNLLLRSSTNKYYEASDFRIKNVTSVQYATSQTATSQFRSIAMHPRTITKSIFFAGSVVADRLSRNQIGNNNLQSKVTGNTLLLNDRLEKPETLFTDGRVTSLSSSSAVPLDLEFRSKSGYGAYTLTNLRALLQAKFDSSVVWPF